VKSPAVSVTGASRRRGWRWNRSAACNNRTVARASHTLARRRRSLPPEGMGDRRQAKQGKAAEGGSRLDCIPSSVARQQRYLDG
jgi:hypothetical protein